MSTPAVLNVTGEVDRPCRLTFADLSAIDAAHQIADVREFDASRQGAAVTLAGVLELVGPRESAAFLGLHAASDDFHASIPLAAVRERGMFIYALAGQPLPEKAGGPVRFFIRDFAACHSDEIDECANVKFVDHVELTPAKGHDNRPEDDQQHEALHREQAEE